MASSLSLTASAESFPIDGRFRIARGERSHAHVIACTLDGLIRHFSNVADGVGTPVYLYDIPARTRNHIEPATAAALADHGNIAGIKDSGGAQETLEEYLAVGREVAVGLDVCDPRRMRRRERFDAQRSPIGNAVAATTRTFLSPGADAVVGQ